MDCYVKSFNFIQLGSSGLLAVSQVSKQMISDCTSSQRHFVIEQFRLGTSACRPNTKLHLSCVICNMPSPHNEPSTFANAIWKIDWGVDCIASSVFFSSLWLVVVSIYAQHPANSNSNSNVRAFRETVYIITLRPTTNFVQSDNPPRPFVATRGAYSDSGAERRATCNIAIVVSCYGKILASWSVEPPQTHRCVWRWRKTSNQRPMKLR